MSQVALNDATGGAGSFSAGLLGVLTKGISAAADGVLSKKFGYGYVDQQLKLDPNGVPVPYATPGNNLSTTDTLKTALQNPYIFAAVAAGALLIGYALIRR